MATHGDIMKGDLTKGGLINGDIINGGIINGDFTKGDMKTTGELTQGCVVTTSHILSELLTQGYANGHPPDTDVIVCTLREEGVSNVVTSTVYPSVPTSPVNNTLDIEVDVEVLSSSSKDRNGSISTPTITQDESLPIISPTKSAVTPASVLLYPDTSCVSPHLASATSMSPHRSSSATSIAPRGSSHYAQTPFFSPSSPQIRSINDPPFSSYLPLVIVAIISTFIHAPLTVAN